ncbi:hypothetical protein EDE15_0016 [Edaphobacter aggregans]|uniref:Dolichyl-phosphate-mannose-protein mannosyltransferase n=2 Tax=Edaphobacter aggregans TaxID=570835 RepID=A0A3R9QZU6_9BACT|nr:hypothetical protein EDE15_0016 [Edaphobacter aggregans]
MASRSDITSMITSTDSSAFSRRTEGLFRGIAAMAILIWVWRIVSVWHSPLSYDDAYMFYRYAEQLRPGHGFSWNAGGGPTYGPTSLLWTATIFLLSMLPLAPGKVLLLGSWLSGGAAVGTTAWAVSANATSSLLKGVGRVAAILGVLLMLLSTFRLNVITGMDTMESVAANALVAGMILLWTREPTKERAGVAGFCGVLAFLVRPDSALPVVLLAILADRLLVERQQRGRTLWLLLGVFFAGMGLDLLLCRLYFGTAVPLSFYVKTGAGYAGYIFDWQPALAGFNFLRWAVVFLLPILVLIDRQNWRIAVTFLVPMAAGFTYFMTLVQQIMGMPSRYYAPLFPFVVIPAMLMIDKALLQWPEGLLRTATIRVAVVAALVLSLGPMRTVRLVDAALLGHRTAYREPVRLTDAGKPLPSMGWFEAQVALADDVIAGLPTGARVASTEVGYMGAKAPQADVIDLAGLNNTEIARHGFSAQRLFAMKPDIVWMPLTDYSYMCGSVYSAPELLRDYDVWDGAFTFGLAVRKDSPYRKEIDEELKAAFAKIYPGLEMKRYLVRSVEWNREPYRWPS